MSSADPEERPEPKGHEVPKEARALAPQLLSTRLVIPAIEALQAYPPARPWRDVARDLGIHEAELLMLAANENVLGPSPKAIEAARSAMSEAHLYPDGAAIGLKTALSKKLGVAENRIVIGNGSNELIELLVRTFVGPNETVATAWPSFVVYRLITQAAGREVVIAPLARDRYDLGALAALVDHRTKLIFIANPNNPTGTYVTRRELMAFASRIPDSAIIVLDEAYFEYTDAKDYPNGLIDLAGRARVVVLRTFSKAHGLAGLRVGYGIMDPALADYLDRVRQPYNVSSVAQEAAIAALGDDEHVEKSRRTAREGVHELEIGLRGLGFEPIPSQANFVCVRVGMEGAVMQDALKKLGILVRGMAGYSMPDAIRITVGTKTMNERVLDAMAQVVGRTRST